MQKSFLNVSQTFYDCTFRLAGLELKSLCHEDRSSILRFKLKFRSANFVYLLLLGESFICEKLGYYGD